MTKQTLQKLLTESDVRILFTKADGTERVLIATLDVPEEKRPKDHPTGGEPDAPNAARALLADTHMRVFDREAQDWRTIVLDRVKEFEPV